MPKFRDDIPRSRWTIGDVAKLAGKSSNWMREVARTLGIEHNFMQRRRYGEKDKDLLLLATKIADENTKMEVIKKLIKCRATKS